MTAHVLPIDIDTARPFITRWHYSKRCPTGKNIFFGWYVDAERYELGNIDTDLFGMALYAVADYGIGVNPYIAPALAEMTGRPITDDNLVELKRLCRIEPKVDGLPLTSFLARCHRLLKRSGTRFVVSFSDPAHGHDGGIYKAANFQHLGQTASENHAIGPDGEVRHRRLYFRHARRNNVSVAEARNELGLQLVKTVPKDRWLLQIGRV